MKDFKSDSSSTLSRFAKDKRLRRPRTESVERVERVARPKSHDENKEEHRPSRNGNSARRSFNPNFTDENKPRFSKERGSSPKERKFEKSGRPAREERSFDRKGFTRSNDKKFDKSNKPFRREAEHKEYPKYSRKSSAEGMRLNRFIAQSGLCSRREADDFIQAGVVTVNGEVVSELGARVRPTDDVRFNGERLKGEKNVYLVLNKPKGYVTTTEDEHADKTVMDLVRGACSERIYPVGRLDKNSLGLLLFTNDGDMTRHLTHPSYMKKKIYEVTLDKALTKADLEALANGIELEDGDAFFDEVQYLNDAKTVIGCEIHSGRNRIVRRMFDHLGYSVEKLDRVYYAGLTKKNLRRGEWRFLTEDEVNRLKSGRYE